MCWMSCYERRMALGYSGRLIIKSDPAMKRWLHAGLAGEGCTAKDLLVDQIERYLSLALQEHLPFGLATGGDDGA